MFTGYDNYWMYDNGRHEPELYFQKNDNFRPSAYTDRYKQVQGKGSSNNMYCYVPHPNTFTTSHQNVPNDQHRVTSTQSMLPSPACLQPYPCSLTYQYLPSEVCSAQSNSVPDSCAPHQNQVLRNVQNYNSGQTVNYKSSAGPVNNQKSFNYKTHTNGIRVKDFSLLNNNSKHNNCNSLLVSGSHQSQQKRPWYYLHDSPPENRQHMLSNGQMQRGSNNYGRPVMVEVNYSYQNYGSTPSHNYHVSNEEQYSRCSAALYQHNAPFKRQICFDSLGQGPEKPSQDFYSGNYAVAQRKIPGRMAAQEAEEQRKPDSGRRFDNNAYNCNASFELNEVDPTSQAQSVRSGPGQNPLQSPSVSTSRTEPTAKSSSHNWHSEVRSLLATVPGATRGTASRDNSTEASRNSDLSSTCSNLASTRLRDCVGDDVSERRKGFESSEGGGGSAGSGVSQLDQQEPGCVRDEENPNLGKETVAVDNSKSALDRSVIFKVENLGLVKDSSEDEKADCQEEAEVQRVKPEVDGSDENENTDNTEQLPDSVEVELPETENSENIYSLPWENSEDKAKTVSIALSKKSQRWGAVILGEAETSFELAEEGAEIDPLTGEDKCRSEINRDKLDLLIEFLKEDGKEPVEILRTAKGDSPPPLTSLQEGNPPKKNRRKLSKTSIVRNKNTEREMISLVSYKTPKYSSVRNSLTEETRREGSSDCFNDDNYCGETVSEEKQPEEDPRGEEPRDSPTPEEEEEGRSPTGSTSDCFCYGRGITREERTVINIMRAFQSLKRHFCASCAFTSPVESIWINIVSGELHCLNCFKKMFMKDEENHKRNSKKYSSDAPKKLKAATAARKDEEGRGRGDEEGKNSEKKPKCEGQTYAKGAQRREDLKDRVEDEDGMCCENSGDLKKDGSGTADKRKTEVGKTQRTKSTEERIYEEHGKKGGGGGAMGFSEGSRKRSNSAEEFVPRKRPFLEEDGGDLRENRVIWWDGRVSRPRSRGSCSSQKSGSSEEEVEKSKKHESGGSKTLNLVERCAEEKSHKTKEGKGDHELKRKEQDVSETPKGKSMTPEEEIDLRRIPIKHSSEKLTVDIEKNKMVEKWIYERAEKKRKNKGESKEQSRSPRNHEEDSNKSEKVVSSSGKLKRRRNREKAETRDPPYVPPRKASAEERKASKMCTKSEEVESRLQKKHEHSAPKSDERTKHSCQKATGACEKKPGGKQHKSSKQCLISRLFKGKRCLKANPSSRYLNKQVHKREPLREEERRREKEAKKNIRQIQPGSFQKRVENRSHKGRHSWEEPTEGEESWHRAWKNGEETSVRQVVPEGKAAEDILEGHGRRSGTGPKSSDSESPLVIRLMKTTTKLSLRLLEETA